MIIRFEEQLKRRIFLADRIEKVEKALITLNLISKDIFFCSDFELQRFKEALKNPELIKRISELI